VTQEEFVTKWRGELFALVFEAEAAGIRSARLSLLNRSEAILRSIYEEMSRPPGPVPAKVLASCKQLFETIKEIAEPPKMTAKVIPFDLPDKTEKK